MDSASELWPHRVDVPVKNTEVKEQWLVQNMGPILGRWYVSRYGVYTATYHFLDEREAVLFALKWR